MQKTTWIVLILIVSLSLNAFLIGVGLGRKASGPDHRPAHAGRLEGPHSLMRALPRELRRQTRQRAMESGDLRGDIMAARQVRLRILEAAIAEPFDPAALDAAAAEARDSDSAIGRRFMDAMVATLKELSPEEREDLRTRVEEWKTHGPSHRRRFKRPLDLPPDDADGATPPE